MSTSAARRRGWFAVVARLSIAPLLLLFALELAILRGSAVGALIVAFLLLLSLAPFAVALFFFLARKRGSGS